MCCKCCIRGCNKHFPVSIVGLSLSLFELILASVYNFHMIGFGMSIIGIITSGLYLHFSIKDERAKQASRDQINTGDTVDEDGEERKLVPQSAVEIMKAQ